MSRPAPCRWHAGGFTLVEVLVSVFIFTIVAYIAYGGYSTSLRQSTRVTEQIERLKEVQTTIRLFTQDFEQLAPRPVRDVLGQSLLPALRADGRAEYLVALTRAGWSNPASTQRSTLQRVHYVLEDETLRRDHWNVLDVTLANEPIKRELLKGVKRVQLRYLDSNQNWNEQWPPFSTQPIAAAGQRSRPLAVEVTIELEDMGTITRLIEVGG